MPYDPNLGTWVPDPPAPQPPPPSPSRGVPVAGGPVSIDPGTGMPTDEQYPGIGEGEAWELYVIDGVLYLVWSAPFDTGDIPIAYETDWLELANWLGIQIHELQQMVTDTLTTEEFESAGGLIAGDFEDVSVDIETGLADWDPFEDWTTELAIAARLAPWLLDPEVAALAAAAHLEGRSLTAAELAGTTWWQTHKAEERQWLVLLASDPATAQQMLEDNRRIVARQMMDAGIDNPNVTIIVDGVETTLGDWIADLVTTGAWSATKLNEQIILLADPHLEGNRDQQLMDIINGVDVDTVRTYEDEVRKLFLDWLGPVYGAVDQSTLDEWASRFRNDPDARIELTEWLKDQRISMFPEHPNREIPYNTISQPYQALVYQNWGVMADETAPYFQDLLRITDAQEQLSYLRTVGLNRGIEKVRNDAAADLLGAFNQVIRVGF